METRLSRKNFLAELSPMQGVVERKSTIPVLSHILLRAEGGTLHMAATDLDVSLTASCEADVKSEGAIAVQARKFIEIIRASDGDDVLLVLDDENQLRIEVGRSRFKINGLSPEDFPTLPEVGGDGRLATSLAGVTAEYGGRLLAAEEIPLVLEELANQEITAEVAYESKWQLADTGADAGGLFAVMIALLVVEWFLRKRWGLV